MATYYIFKSSQTWEVPEGVGAVDAIIVGGGGGSGTSITGGQVGWPGGAGAGGVLAVTGIPLTPGASMPIVIGAGGVWGDHQTPPTPGGNSSFAGHTAIGGGIGQIPGGTDVNDGIPEGGGGSGGSGGGAIGGGCGADPNIRIGGAGIPGQGFPGGSVSAFDETCSTIENKPGAGGGGAAQAGESITSISGSPPKGGKGGDGFTLEALGFWDQDAANAVNPDVLGDVDLTGHIDTPEWTAGTYAAGQVVWHTYPWRLYVSTADGTNSEPPTGQWRRFFYAVGGGGGGMNGVNKGDEAAPGIGGGGEGGFIIAAGSSPLGPQANTGGGVGGGGGSSTLKQSGAAGIIILRVADTFECTDVGIDQIVYAHARRAGIPGSRIDVSALVPDSDFPSVIGMGIGRPATSRNIVEILQRYAFFDLADIGGRMIASRRDRQPDGVIGGDDLRGHVYGDTPPSLARRERDEDYELPRSVRVKYSQAFADYEPGSEGYDRRVTDAEGVVDIDLSAIAMDPDRAAMIAEVATLEQIVHRENTDVSLVATDANKELKPGDIKTLDVKARQDTVRITELGYVYPGVMKLKVGRHDPSIYFTDAVGAGRNLFGSVIFAHGSTTFALLDVPLVREFDDNPGYFTAMGGNPTVPGLVEGWPGGDLQRQEPSGWEDIAQILRPGSVFGAAQNALGDGDPWVPLDQELTVTANGQLEPATLQELCTGANLAALECTGGWELIRFMTATFASGVWTLGGLVRGVHGTEWATGMHSVGNRFILLTGVAQVLTDIVTELNLSRQHNAATLGQEANPADEVAFAWTGVDRIPYAPVHLAAERDSSDDILLRWFRRDRIGKELQSGQALPLSEDLEAYEVDIYNAAGDTVLRTITSSTTTATYTAAQQTTDFGSLPIELDWDVRQMGELGRGYATRITSEGL